MSEFVNKVYDRYLNKDFSFGQDNLNPVREISLANDSEVVNELISSVKEKIEEISSRYPDIEEPLTGTSNTGAGTNGDPTCLLKAKNRAGGDIFLIPSFENEEDALLDEVKKLMLKAAAVASIGDNNTPIGFDEVSAIDCNGFFDLLSGEQIDTSEDKFDNDFIDNFSDAEDENDSIDNAEDENDSNNGSNSELNGDNNFGGLYGSNGGNVASSIPRKINTFGRDKDESDTKTQEDSNENEDDIFDNYKQTENNVRECAKADLALLKVIAQILKVISTIKKILNPTLNIIMEIAEIVTLACQVWHNPPALAEIISKVISKIIAILCMLISMLLQMIWDLLGLDCVTEEAMELLDEIRDALAGISSIFAEIDATAVSFANGINEAIDSVKMAEDAVSEAMKAIPTLKQAQDYFDFKKAGQAIADDWKNNYKTYAKAAGAEVLEQSGLREKISDAVVKVEEIGDQWRQVSKSAAKMVGANSGVQRLMSSFENVESL